MDDKYQLSAPDEIITITRIKFDDYLHQVMAWNGYESYETTLDEKQVLEEYHWYILKRSSE